MIDDYPFCRTRLKAWDDDVGSEMHKLGHERVALLVKYYLWEVGGIALMQVSRKDDAFALVLACGVAGAVDNESV